MTKSTEYSPKSRPHQYVLHIIFLFMFVFSSMFCRVGYVIGQIQNKPTDEVKPTAPSEVRTQVMQDKFPFGNYGLCLIYQRVNSNIAEAPLRYPDRSELKCTDNSTIDGSARELLVVKITDPEGTEAPGKNSIYRAWRDDDGHKIFIVDQTGAKEGEGVGKVILLNEKKYSLISCFYYDPDNFWSLSYSAPISDMEADIAKSQKISVEDSRCKNFKVEIIFG